MKIWSHAHEINSKQAYKINHQQWKSIRFKPKPSPLVKVPNTGLHFSNIDLLDFSPSCLKPVSPACKSELVGLVFAFLWGRVHGNGGFSLVFQLGIKVAMISMELSSLWLSSILWTWGWSSKGYSIYVAVASNISTGNLEFPSYLKTSKDPTVKAWQFANSRQPFWNRTSPSRFVNFTVHFVPFGIVRKAMEPSSTSYLLINFFGIRCKKDKL